MQNIAPLGMYNPMLNSYMGYAGLQNICDSDYAGLGGISTPLYSDPMSMTGSLYGGFMPYMPTFGGLGGTQNYFDYMDQYLHHSSDYQRKMVEYQRDNQISLGGPDAGIKKAVTYLADRIQKNEQEQIPAALAMLKDAVRQKYPDANEQNIGNFVAVEWSNYSQASIPEAIRANSRSSFKQGMLQILGLGMASSVTAEENISKIFGQPVSRAEHGQKIAGRATGGAIYGAIGGLIVSGFNPIGALIGAIGGGIAAAVTTKKVK